MDKRPLVQWLSALAYNAHLSGFATGSIWQGKSKGVCVPGLNCYSCPGALGACPIGALQSSMAGMVIRFPFYVLGMLLLFGLIFGRRICGWLCPFGLVQDLLHKVPSPKLKKNDLTRKLTLSKYVIAVLFVLVLPLAFYYVTGIGAPTFCKYICPAGTLEAGWPLTILNPELRQGLGFIFLWKSFILVSVVTAAVFIYRPFCRFICPLGAWYSLFNHLSFLGIQVEEDKCTHCNACIKVCKMDCHKVGDRECINCGECAKICPTHAISFRKVV